MRFLFSSVGVKGASSGLEQLCYALPFIAVLPLGCIAVIVEVILRDETSDEGWNEAQARNLLSSDSTSFRKILARAYLMVFYPLLFIAGWLAGYVLTL